MSVCVQTELEGVTLLRRGKVRDVYEVGDKLLLVATDRVSAFDVVLPTPIPMKGAVLTQLSRFWFGMMSDIVPNHVLSTDVEGFPPDLQAHREGIRLPAGLRECDRLPEPLFTPATKADTGHDLNISEKEMEKLAGKEDTAKL